MKWVNHEILTGVIVYAVTEDFLSAAFSMAGAIFPDKVEGAPQANFTVWRKRHRSWSHWPPLYLAFLGLLMSPVGSTMPRELLGIREVGIFLMVGALLHIAEDALCGKVPFLLPHKKVGIRLFKVGSTAEYLVTIGLILLVLFVAEYLKGGTYG